MSFTNVIDDYTAGTTGTITLGSETVNYTITDGAPNDDRPNTVDGARVDNGPGGFVEVTFEQPVVGISLTFDRSNSGEVYFVTIGRDVNDDPIFVDLNVLIANGDAVFETQLADGTPAGTHFVTAGGGITSSGTFTNDSLGIVRFNIPIETIGIAGDPNGSGGFDVVEIGVDDVFFDVVCFDAGTLIDTPKGAVTIADLRVGDRVSTLDGADHDVLFIGTRDVTKAQRIFEPRLAPVLIKAGALGHGLPRDDLRVSRQHRVLVASRIAQRLTGQTHVLIPAIRLVGLPGITIDRQIAPITYHYLLLPGHAVLLANGAPAESLFMGPMSVQVLENLPIEDDVHFPPATNAAPMRPAYPFVSGKIAKKIVGAHQKHARPLLEALELVLVP